MNVTNVTSCFRWWGWSCDC